MADSETERQFKQEFTRRVKAARVARKYKQWQMAELLEPGMPQDKYKQYEGRSLMPHHLIGRFCLLCRVNPEWLITGHGKMAPPETPEITPDIMPRAAARKSRSKRAA